MYIPRNNIAVSGTRGRTTAIRSEEVCALGSSLSTYSCVVVKPSLGFLFGHGHDKLVLSLVSPSMSSTTPKVLFVVLILFLASIDKVMI